ncbi:RNA polymerase II transcription elongation factor SpEAF [Lithohypha guttulata]|uniref:RNA polymerase II transcription elongation factor SpEAF n=1 Tax=Lithohypha guttulata TaxID=1690604 RepID=UPI002DE1E694|nr:RNA polymerase II transcription elongation factor SpEAF [Lithohypha guttulata]KAK5104676.1 RNA polymerase II transcription elongation factor SpEAF [Lithohypha guttulata]
MSPSKSASEQSRRTSVQPPTRPTSPRSTADSKPVATRPIDEPPATTRPVKQAENAAIESVPPSVVQQTDPPLLQQSSVVPVSQGKDTLNGRPEDIRKKTPTIPPTLETQDAQSSPTSSNGRPSSHTPGPEAGSPTTSPGDDTAATLDILNMKPPEPRREEPQTPDIHIAPTHKMSVSFIDVDMMDADPTTTFDSPVQPLEHPPTPPDPKHKKPAITVDVQNDSRSYFDSRQESTVVETPAAISQSSARQTPAATPAVDSSRRATRIQSGVLQKKSVSEILGESPRPGSPNNDASAAVSARAADKDRKERERSRLSTVVFAKPQKPTIESDTIELARLDQPSKELAKQADRDYMYTLFESKAHSQNRSGSLTYLLQHSHKAISTSDHLVDYHYQAHCRALKRLYSLQNQDNWSLRQRKRAEEPARPTSHWDFLLDHAKWMRTDFREERRWKLAAARAVAEACAEWMAADRMGRKLLQVHVRPPRQFADLNLTDGPIEQAPSSPPDLEPHGEDDSVSEDIADPRDVVTSIAPAAIFSLGASDFTFAIDKTPAFDKLLNELPLYQPSKIEPDLSKSNLAERLDSRWKTDIVPVSRFATEKLKVKDYKPPLKRSRYDYDVDDSPPAKRPALEPRETEVALFMPENKHIRDRIHPGHAFRPPAEHPMPSQAFFETRTSSQWLAVEDDEVRRQAREYSFNWTLISELMTPPTLYVSGQDRRTAWECFERWIGLEGMPADMAKTPYFKTYSNRIETAQRNVQAQWEELERRNNQTPSTRRKTTLPVRVERKHNRRHLFMLDAMRKLAKKREAVRQKQAQSADMAAMRKSNDVHAPRPGTKTPAEWSQLKYEREQKMVKQQEMYKQQLIAHQRAVVQQQRAGQSTPANGMPIPPNAGNQLRVPGSNGAPVPAIPNGQMQVQNGQPRPHPNMMGMHQGMGMPAGLVGPKGMPQPMPIANRGMVGSPQQIKMQQELLRQAQVAQQNGGHSSPSIQQASMANGQNLNNAFMNSLNQGNNQSSTPNHASPLPQTSHVPQSLSSGSMPKINQLAVSIREQYPNMSDEEVKGIATRQLLQWQQQATAAAAGNPPRPKAVNQAALNAAMGAANSGAYAAAQNQNAMNMNANVNSTTNMGHPQMSYDAAQQYHQRIRMQQQQAQQNAARMHAPITPGISASPVMNMARPVSQHSQQSGMNGGVGRTSVTPARDQRSGSVSTSMNNGQAQGTGASQVQSQSQGPQSSPMQT